MAELLVVGFQNNVHRASGVLDELRVLDDMWILQLRDAIAVHRDAEGALHMDQSYQPTGGQGAGWGGTIGLLIGATLGLSFTAGASAAIAAGAMVAGALSGTVVGATSATLDAVFWKASLGIPESFVEEVSTLVVPGGSAIYAIVESGDCATVIANFQKYGATVFRTEVTRGQKVAIEKAISDGSR